MRMTVLTSSLKFLLVVLMLMSVGFLQARGDIVALWLFDEGNGDVAKDSSGNGHDGNLTNGPKWVEGKFGKALEFDGVDDYVDPGVFPITYNNAFTAMIWVYPTQLRFEQTIGRGQSWDDQDGDIQLRIEDAQGHVKPHLWAGSWVVFQSAGAVKANEWSHLAMTFDGEKLLLYINGELDAMSATAGAPGEDKGNDNPAFIGCYLDQDGVATGSHYVGIMDDICYMDEALEQEKIGEIMAKGMSNYLAIQPSGKLTATWGEIKDQ